jgi:uncharacterized protein YdaU (DUF1376 family)
MSRPWMPLYVADYRADTAHLSAAQHGAYLLLIMHYWTTGGLPKDDAAMARIACMSPAEWKRAYPVIYPFFEGDWTHKRIDAELARAADISRKRAASAKQRHSKCDAIAEQLDTHARTLPPSQSQKKEDAPGGATSAYAFESGVIRLNERDFTLWKASFSHLDVPAELLAMTQWASEQRSWFNAVKGALAKKNQQAKERKTAGAEFKWNGIEGVL